MKHKLFFYLLLAGLLGGVVLNGSAQGTAFLYQGRLNDNGSPASAPYDLRFAIYDAATNGNAIGFPQTNYATVVSSGLFTATLDFGPIFIGVNYWLAIGVRTNGSTNAFTLLWPRQPLLPVPYAVFAKSASNLLGTLPATQLTGTLPSAQVAGTYFGAVNFTNSTNAFSGKFFGDGLALTNLNATMLATGIVADVRLSTNVALLNQNQTNGGANLFTGANVFSGSNTFSGPNSFANGANTFTGAFTGNGSGLTALNATQLSTGTTADARLSANVALLNQSQTYAGSNLFTGGNVFTNRGNSFIGSFFGNGLVGWIPFSGASTQAMSNAGYLLTSPQFTLVTMPAAPILGDIVRISGAGVGGWRAVGSGAQTFIGNFSSYRNSLWTPATVLGNNWVSLAASATGMRMYAAGGSGLFTSTDAGQTWNGPNAVLSGAWGGVATSADGSKVFAVIPGKAIQISSDGGATWPANGGAVASNCVSIACSADGTHVVAAVKNGSVYYSINSGGSWFATGLPNGTWTVAFSGNGNLFAAGNTSGTLYSSASGSVAVGGNFTALVASTDGSKLAAASSSGLIYTSSNSGTNWAATSAPASNWSCLAASADCTRLVAGISNSVLYASANFGATWSALALTGNQAWAALAASDDGTKLAAVVNTASGGLYYFSAGGQSLNTSTNSFITGSQGAAVELQYIGNNQFMPVSSTGSLWVN